MKIARNFLSIVASLTLMTLAADAQVPVQTAPAKVGVVNSATFSNSTGGITRYVNALRTLENEFKARRDDITQSVTRLEGLQNVPAGATQAQIETRRDQAQTLQIEITRKQEDARAAYSKRFAQLTGPIQKSIVDALKVFARARGIDVIIDPSKFPEGVLLVNENADMTAAFIRDFNSKNP
jgi:Skp family chaperone for outer membrane proteins